MLAKPFHGIVLLLECVSVDEEVYFHVGTDISKNFFEAGFNFEKQCIAILNQTAGANRIWVWVSFDWFYSETIENFFIQGFHVFEKVRAVFVWVFLKWNRKILEKKKKKIEINVEIN